MNKIKEMMLESKAIKYLGEDKYNSIKKGFTSTLIHMCYGMSNPESLECRQVLDELKRLKNQIWINTLLECLGGAMCGVSLYRMDLYGLEETIISCAVGLGAVVIAGIRNRIAKKVFNETQDDFVEYVYSKMYGNYRHKINESIEESGDNSNYYLVTCKAACNELLD